MSWSPITIFFGETSMKVELTMRWAIRGMRLASAFGTEGARRVAYCSCALPPESMSITMTPTSYLPINIAVRIDAPASRSA
jgi:hypothetical protein